MNRLGGVIVVATAIGLVGCGGSTSVSTASSRVADLCPPSSPPGDGSSGPPAGGPMTIVEPTTTLPPDTVRLTERDRGHAVRILAGRYLVVTLQSSGDAQWDEPRTCDQHLVQTVSAVITSASASATFRAEAVGSTRVTAALTPPCPASTATTEPPGSGPPKCPGPTRMFTVTIEVYNPPKA